jgi:hypothetical protein
MHLAQIRVALDACDRRDAALALQALETTHAAVAPLLVGREGSSLLQRCSAALRRVIRPGSSGPADSPVKKLFAMARKQDAARKAQGGG